MARRPWSTRKYCDMCQCEHARRTRPVRTYRWMRIQDNDFYKHQYLVKADLCSICAGKVLDTLLEMLRYDEAEFIRHLQLDNNWRRRKKYID